MIKEKNISPSPVTPAPVVPIIGKKEKQFLELLAKIFSNKIISQMKYSELSLRKKREMESEVSEKLKISLRGSRRLLTQDNVDFQGTNRQRITKKNYQELDEHIKENKRYFD